jgi:hypothetical protein
MKHVSAEALTYPGFLQKINFVLEQEISSASEIVQAN